MYLDFIYEDFIEYYICLWYKSAIHKRIYLERLPYNGFVISCIKLFITRELLNVILLSSYSFLGNWFWFRSVCVKIKYNHTYCTPFETWKFQTLSGLQIKFCIIDRLFWRYDWIPSIWYFTFCIVLAFKSTWAKNLILK